MGFCGNHCGKNVSSIEGILQILHYRIPLRYQSLFVEVVRPIVSSVDLSIESLKWYLSGVSELLCENWCRCPGYDRNNVEFLGQRSTQPHRW